MNNPKLALYSTLTQDDLYKDSQIIEINKEQFYIESKNAEIIYKRELCMKPRGSVVYSTNLCHTRFFKIIY